MILDGLLSSLMGAVSGRSGDGLDPKRLSPEEAAEYLWRRFVLRKPQGER